MKLLINNYQTYINGKGWSFYLQLTLAFAILQNKSYLRKEAAYYQDSPWTLLVLILSILFLKSNFNHTHSWT
jgi:hypothetical protein